MWAKGGNTVQFEMSETEGKNECKEVGHITRKWRNCLRPEDEPHQYIPRGTVKQGVYHTRLPNYKPNGYMTPQRPPMRNPDQVTSDQAQGKNRKTQPQAQGGMVITSRAGKMDQGCQTQVLPVNQRK